jgi:hypothetical protein
LVAVQIAKLMKKIERNHVAKIELEVEPDDQVQVGLCVAHTFRRTAIMVMISIEA